MNAGTDAREAYLGQYAAAKATLPGHGLPWLAEAREAAIGRFAEQGFPTRKLEAWKFTDLRPLTRATFAPARARANGIDRAAMAPFLPAGLDCHLLVFVDGHHRADLSDVGALPQGARVASLAEVLVSDPDLVAAQLDNEAGTSGPAALNAALAADGAVVALAEGVAVERPVHLLFIATGADAPAALHLRNLVVAAARARATVIETYAAPGAGGYWTNAVTDVVAETDATLRHVKLQAESAEAFHLAATRTRIARGGAYDSFAASLGARLSRNEIAAALDGAGIECRLSGAYLARGRQHMDTTTVIDHAEPGSYSNEHYRGVLDDAAHGVFQGRIVVRPDAQKTDAHQLNKNLLLSESAQIDTKPELEIHADDVKCSHGATAGELDAAALFYLRSRGLDPGLAERLLIEAFVGEIVDAVEAGALRDHLWRLVAGWLPRLGN
ncbi:MAG: Fe-S cluster assembly protein SufD [Alphaproteobacteria bacterium]